MPQSHLDPVVVAITVASVIFSPVLASIVGPYAVIVLASTAGGAWSLGRRQRGGKLGAGLYFLRLNITAMLLTVGVANFVARWLGTHDSQWMFGFVAFAIGGIGDDWPKVGRWLARRAGRLIERKTGSGAGQ